MSTIEPRNHTNAVASSGSRTKVISRNNIIVSLFTVVSAVLFTAAISFAQVPTNFEGFSTGTANGQFGWSSLGSAGSGCGLYDHMIVNGTTLVPAAPAEFGARSLRISNAVTSGCFGDQTFTSSNVNEAGEASATNGGLSGGMRTTHYETEFVIASVTPGAQQPGLFMQVSPDRGDGSRMSYVGFDDQADGIHLIFYDYQDFAPFGAANGDDANGCNAGGDDFIQADIATMTRTPHRIKITIDFVVGPRNDVVKVYLDGSLIKTGGSWEDYYRYCAEQNADNNTHTVDSLLFRTGGSAVPANVGKGYIVDNFNATLVVDDDGSSSLTDCNAADPAYSTIQAAITAAPIGYALKVCPGTYSEDLTLSKRLTINGAQSGIDARGRVIGIPSPATESILTTANPLSVLDLNTGSADSVIDGFTFSGGGNTGTQGAIRSSTTPVDRVQILNNYMIGFKDAAIWLNRSGVDMTISQNVMDGALMTSGSQIIFLNGPQSFNGLNLTNNWIKNGGTRVGVFADGDHTLSESATRPVTISGNLFDGNSVGINFGSRSLGKLTAPVTGTYAAIISNNTFSNNAFDGYQGGIQHGLMTGNTFTNNGRHGLALTSFGNLNADRGAQNSVITGNQMTGNGFVNTGSGISVSVQGAGLQATNLINFNRIVANATGVSYSGADTVDLSNNWWGCNYGPGTGGAGCSGTPNGKGGSSTANLISAPYLTLTSAASPNQLSFNGVSTVTSKLTINSAASDTAGSGTLPNGISASYLATLGTAAPNPSFTASGVTSTTFTAGNVGGMGGVATTVDQQTVNAAISVQAPCPSISTPSGNTMTGVPITIPVNTDDMTGRGAISADFTFSYDDTLLQPAALNTATAGTVAGAGSVVTYRTPTTPVTPSPAGTIIVSVFSTAGFTGAGSLIDLHFNVIGPIGSTSGLNVSNFIYNGGSICLGSGSNGTLTVISGTMSGQVTYAHSPFVAVPGVLMDAPGSPHISDTTNMSGNYSMTGFGPGSYTVTPSKADALYTDSDRGIYANDASLIAQHVVGLITLNATQLQAAKVSGNLTPTLTTYDAALIAQWITHTLPGTPGNLTGKWVFTNASTNYANVNANYAGQNYTAILMGDVSGGWPGLARPELLARGLQTDKSDVRASVPNVEAPAGSVVSVPLTIDNLKGSPIGSYEFDIEYDPAVLEPFAVAASVAGTISDGLSVISNSPQPGVLKVVVYGAMPVRGDGVYVNLRFSTIGGEGTNSPLIIRGFRFNDGEVDPVTVDGQLFITAASNNAAIHGRLLSAYGQGIGNTRITLTSTTGETFTTFSSMTGHFDFSGLVVGETYTVTVQAKRYRFSPRIVNVGNAVADLDMIADQ